MDFTEMSMQERAVMCVNLYREGEEGSAPKCSDNYNENQDCNYICCGYCQDYADCARGKCTRVWIDPGLLSNDPTGRLFYVLLETGKLVSGSIPCLISEMYDDNE